MPAHLLRQMPCLGAPPTLLTAPHATTPDTTPHLQRKVHDPSGSPAIQANLKDSQQKLKDAHHPL
jgi:hypothetical protein